MKIKNKYNKKVKKISIILIVLLILFLNLEIISAINYYNVKFNYNQGEINIISIKTENSNDSLRYNKVQFDMNFIDSMEINYSNEGKEYSYNLKIFDNNKILNESSLNFSTVVFYDYFDSNGSAVSGGRGELTNVSFNIYFPYYENAKEIAIYNVDGEEIDRESIGGYFESYCGDSICNNDETCSSCASDCGSCAGSSDGGGGGGGGSGGGGAGPAKKVSNLFNDLVKNKSDAYTSEEEKQEIEKPLILDKSYEKIKYNFKIIFFILIIIFLVLLFLFFILKKKLKFKKILKRRF